MRAIMAARRGALADDQKLLTNLITMRHASSDRIHAGGRILGVLDQDPSSDVGLADLYRLAEFRNDRPGELDRHSPGFRANVGQVLLSCLTAQISRANLIYIRFQTAEA